MNINLRFIALGDWVHALKWELIGLIWQIFRRFAGEVHVTGSPEKDARARKI